MQARVTFTEGSAHLSRRVEAAIEAAEWDEVDLGQLVLACTEGYRTVYPGRRLDARIPEVDLQVKCAPDLLAQALDKLVDNAFSLTGPEDELTIEAIQRLRERAGDLTLLVDDGGHGHYEAIRKRDGVPDIEPAKGRARGTEQDEPRKSGAAAPPAAAPLPSASGRAPGRHSRGRAPGPLRCARLRRRSRWVRWDHDGIGGR